MFLFCNEDKKKKERLNSVLKTTHNLIKKNDIKDVRKNPVYSLIRAMSNYHLYDIVRELYEDEEVTDVQSIYKDIGEYLINSEKLNNSKSFKLVHSSRGLSCGVRPDGTWSNRCDRILFWSVSCGGRRMPGVRRVSCRTVLPLLQSGANR